MSVRISATDWADGGISDEDTLAIARAFAAAGCDLVDVSTGQTVHDAEPVYGRMFQVPWSDMIRNEAGIATMCVGNITAADQINTILAAGRADLVALGRPHLVNPFFTLQAAAWYGAQGIHCPPQYLPGRDQIFRNAVRDRADLVALARPHLTNPSFTLHAAAQYGVKDIACPPQYLWGKDALMRNEARNQADLRELRIKARPRSHAPDPAALPRAAE